MNKFALTTLLALIIGYYGYLLITPYSQDSVEGIVAYHQSQPYPYSDTELRTGSVPLYGRLYYMITGSFQTSSPLLGGRVVSLISLLSIAICIYFNPLKQNGSFTLAITMLLLQVPLLRFALVNRPDLPALAVSHLALTVFLKWKERSLFYVIPLLVITFFIKQTAPIASIITIGTLLILDRRWKVIVGCVIGGVLLILVPFMLQPTMWFCMVRANQNSMALSYGITTLVKVLPLLLITISLLRYRLVPKELLIYLVSALIIALVTSFKSGSNSNYFIETAIVVSLIMYKTKVLQLIGSSRLNLILVFCVFSAGHTVVTSQMLLRQSKERVNELQSSTEYDSFVQFDCTSLVLANKVVLFPDLHIIDQLWESPLLDTLEIIRMTKRADTTVYNDYEKGYWPRSIIPLERRPL